MLMTDMQHDAGLLAFAMQGCARIKHTHTHTHTHTPLLTRLSSQQVHPPCHFFSILWTDGLPAQQVQQQGIQGAAVIVIAAHHSDREACMLKN